MLIIIEVDDWEVMYVEGEAAYQGHGMNRYDFLKFVEQYLFKSKDIFTFWADEVDEKDAYKCGRFPHYFSDLKGDYSL